MSLAWAVPFVDGPHPLVSWVLAAAAIILLGMGKSGFGSGIGVISSPLLILAVGSPQKALGSLLPLMLVADVLSIYHHWGTWDGKQMRRLVPASVVGIAVGAVLIFAMGDADEHGRALERTVGYICVVYPVGEFLKNRLFRKVAMGDRESGDAAICDRPLNDQSGIPGALSGAGVNPPAEPGAEPLTDVRGSLTRLFPVGAGFFAGVVSTLAHAAGPVITIYLLTQKLPRQTFIGTAVIYFFLVNFIKLVPYQMLGMLKVDNLELSLWLLPLIPVGTTLGAWLNRRMNDGNFRRLVLGLNTVTGISLILNWP
ncbi:MAG: sulfite exporter TauE/SafE family protein [Phycisphaeraceae bacterium]|nr:sulfite exporter TauE/SafE family protein [Phycisphaeraceae bacterium]